MTNSSYSKQMKIAIVFRKNALPNLFREIILSSLQHDFDDYLICHAFFQEPYVSNKRQIKGGFSTSNDVINALQTSTYSKNISIYGLYSANTWAKQFDIFCSNLKKSGLQNKTFSFSKFNNKSHAKVFFAKEENKITLAIIGSSNLSAGAFSLNNQKNKWNHECDVIFWDSSPNSLSSQVINKILIEDLPQDIYSSIFILDYDEDHFLNTKMGITDKLIHLENLIINNSKILTI